MSVMKTSLTIIPMCPRERFSPYKKLSRLVLCYKKDWATLLHFIYFCYLLLVTNYLITKLSVTYYFSACREYLAENRLSFPSAPRWVRHSYLSKGLRQIPYTCGSSQRLAQQDTGDIITHVYAQIVHKDYYVLEEDDRSLAFLTRRATLDGIVQKHVELAANATAPHTSVGDPAHQGVRMSLMDPYVSLSFRQIHVVVYGTTSNYLTFCINFIIFVRTPFMNHART